MNSFSPALEKARKALNKGDFRNAFSLIVDVPVTHPEDLLRKTSLIAESGIALIDSKIIEYAVYLLERHIKEIVVIPSIAPYYWFNLANLKSNFLAINESNGVKRCFYERNNTKPVREAYQKALELCGDNVSLKSAILKSHARFLVGMGRDWEAFALYNQLMKLNPEDEEIILERNKILYDLSGCAPTLEDELKSEVKYYFSRLKNNLPDERAGKFHSVMSAGRGGKNDTAEFSFPRNTVETHTNQEYQTIMHTLKNNLYLSPCADCCQCDRSVGDFLGFGPRHALIVRKKSRPYNEVAHIFGRLTERYKAFRRALLEHEQARVPDEHRHEYLPQIEGWRSIPASSMSLIFALSSSPQFIDGLLTVLALFMGDEYTAGNPEAYLGASSKPAASFRAAENPALHAFWDLWIDGMEGLIDGADLPRIMGQGLRSRECEELSLDSERLGRKTLSFLVWLRYLMSYLLRLYDREVQNQNDKMELWPLQTFFFRSSN